MIFPVFDLHCDTSLKLLGKKCDAEGSLRNNAFHFDLERAAKYPAFAQCFACFTSPLEHLPGKMTIEDMFERQLSVLLREINGNSDLIAQACSGKDVLSNKDSGLMSAIFTIEGPAGFGYDPALLENLSQIGFRMTTLGWNENNPLTGSHLTGDGLSALGREYVKEAHRAGILIDVSHISDQGFWDVIDIAQGPVIASHSNSRAVFNCSRNITDDMFAAICRTGGVVGVNFGAQFIGDMPTLDMLCEHILHFLELDSDGKHIALGGDLDGVSVLPDGFCGIESYDLLAESLKKYGLSDEFILNIFWNNATGVFDYALCDNKK